MQTAEELFLIVLNYVALQKTVWINLRLLVNVSLSPGPSVEVISWSLNVTGKSSILSFTTESCH